MTGKTKEEIRDLVADNLPDNISGLITPIKHREVLLEIINSMWSLAALEPTQASESAFTHSGLHNFTGGIQSNGNDLLWATKAKYVNSVSDLPTPIAGVITLAANTTYFLANDINVSANRFVFSDRSILRGLESLNITLTYTGTGDLFTMSNVTSRVGDMTVSATSGRLFNWTDTLGLELRVVNLQSTSAQYGTFTGALSILRFTNVSPVFTTGGLTFAGSWASVLWEVSGAGVLGGTFFDLGTATFNSILVDKTLMTLAAGTTFLSGLADSGNILAGGVGTVLLTRIGGTGTPLSGITVDDALWEFFHNDEIADTRPDGLLSMQGNTTETVIATATVPVLVAGTWVVERASQFTGDVNGRLTYNGGKPVTVPITAGVSAEPASGTNKTIGAFIAINGTAVANSRATTRTDAGDPKRITVIWQAVLQPDDYVEVFVSNETDTVNVLVTDAVHRIN